MHNVKTPTIQSIVSSAICIADIPWDMDDSNGETADKVLES